MSDIVKIGWSGGKDSSCATHLHLMRGDKVKAVCYIPYLTDEIPLIMKDHFNFIIHTEQLFKSLGAEVIITHGPTYYECVTRRTIKGKNKGKIIGFPFIIGEGACSFKRDSKMIALQEANVGEYDYTDIGIAINECCRNKLFEYRYGNYQQNWFNAPPEDDLKLRSILCELNMTTVDTMKYCEVNGILSPHYGKHRRDGCALCFNASQEERDEYFADYPEAIRIVKELQEIVKKEKPDNYPLREYKWFI